MNDLNHVIASAGIISLLMIGIWIVVSIIILKIITIIITNTVLDVIEKRQHRNGGNWWQK